MAITAGLAGSPSCRISAAATWSAGPDTLIAMDGTVEIRTPHDDCLLVMPSLRRAEATPRCGWRGSSELDMA